jgi:hypothetical protein
LLLLTDALAAWFLQQYESKERPWTLLQGLGSEADFEELVAGLRKENKIRNDDVTAVCIRMQEMERAARGVG